ncbi:hypothetical protein AVEN_53745-1 [Araneus ventricosus]|uniref:Uncharacterized protein n=1 Tax=Araneus ventricosus TaxID=182803 RepID=A0A4Y2WFA6_ARAVE|nr:hypothetical protein AVEN_53745-1 [Araneus ventricosus]
MTADSNRPSISEADLSSQQHSARAWVIFVKDNTHLGVGHRAEADWVETRRGSLTKQNLKYNPGEGVTLSSGQGVSRAFPKGEFRNRVALIHRCPVAVLNGNLWHYPLTGGWNIRDGVEGCCDVVNRLNVKLPDLSS